MPIFKFRPTVRALMKWLPAVMVGIALCGCTAKKSVRSNTSSAKAANDNSGTADTVGTTGGDAQEGVIEICKRIEESCAKTGPRTFCELKKFPGYVINDGHRIHARAAGECESKRLVLAEACARAWDIKSLDAIECQADGGGGTCPVAEPICTAEYEPHVCAAGKHGGAAIAADRPLTAWGPNSCHANLALRRAACARNLAPENLAEISCKPMESFSGDCPQRTAVCEKSSDAQHECTTSVTAESGGSIELSGSGTSDCEARAQLASKVCAAGFSPAESAQSVNCRKL